MPKTKEVTDIRDIILNKLKEEERSLSWLHRRTDIPYDTLYSCLKSKLFNLSQQNLDKINEALGTEYTLE